jgi:mRNA turnover protein 4
VRLVFVFTFENLRTSFVRDVRADLKESRLFLGKNSVAQVALGRSPEEEVRDNLRNVSSKLDGDSGLLFTNRSKKEITK